MHPASFKRSQQHALDRQPALSTKFFYSSPIAIDDPLSPVPPALNNDSSPSIQPPRPFSIEDNKALESQWLKLVKQLPLDRLETRIADSHDQERIAGSKSEADGRGQRSRSPRVSLLDTVATQNLTGNARDSTGNVSADHDTEDEGLARRPFARAPSRRTAKSLRKSQSEGTASASLNDEDLDPDGEETRLTSLVTVGVSRLHQVVMPALRLEPIYWAPIHDTSEAVRATWFYHENMLPIEANVADMLEAGYLRLKPWTNTWRDELASAVRVGAAGEERIMHPLWPKEEAAPDMKQRSAASPDTKEQDPAEASRQIALIIARQSIDNSSAIESDHRAAGKNLYGRNGTPKIYADSAVIYVNDKDAYLLRPNIQPSEYYRRRPLAEQIQKGRSVGIRVIRGWAQERHDELHNKKPGKRTLFAQAGVFTTPAHPEAPDSDRPEVTDLILVIHGIGQKLSERVEAFNFTHAMNAFRREINVELGAPPVQSHLRAEMGGIMALPINWRRTLSFEDGGYRQSFEDDPSANHYSLRDITLDTLPTVRNLVSDVMLDVPYYLSHHRETMLRAVAREANRIYKLWCQNNASFEKNGRVHLIAHSLGSVMAMDILSRQPTFVSAGGFDENSQFAFDTSNLFLCGSPAGFFLLLQNAALIPRRGRRKGAMELDTAGEAGIFGCLAVDNIFNIMDPYDPVACRLNATVDREYSVSLKIAYVPSASTSWFSFGRTTLATANVPSAQRPSLVDRLPFNVELETHNFSREERAETKAFMLNDNGQIDYLLKYGGGTIEYIALLGAHSSYWTSRDFVRLVVLETGRKPGRESTLVALRAVKKKAHLA